MTPADALAVFAERVATDKTLRDRLAAFSDHDTFATACVAAGREHGFEFSEADVRGLLQARHRFWLHRQIL